MSFIQYGKFVIGATLIALLNTAHAGQYEVRQMVKLKRAPWHQQTWVLTEPQLSINVPSVTVTGIVLQELNCRIKENSVGTITDIRDVEANGCNYGATAYTVLFRDSYAPDTNDSNESCPVTFMKNSAVCGGSSEPSYQDWIIQKIE